MIICTKTIKLLTSVFCNWVGGFFLKECDHHVGVQFKSGNDHQNEQRGVGTYADEGIVANGNQSCHYGAEHHPGVDGVLPLVSAFKAHYELKLKMKTR